MPDQNSAECSTGYPSVDQALKRLQAQPGERFRILEDAALVQAQLEGKAGERIKEHAYFLVAHQAAINSHDRQLEEDRIAVKSLASE